MFLCVPCLPYVSFLMNSNSVKSCYSPGHFPPLPPPPFSCEKCVFACLGNGCNIGTPRSLVKVQAAAPQQTYILGICSNVGTHWLERWHKDNRVKVLNCLDVVIKLWVHADLWNLHSVAQRKAVQHIHLGFSHVVAMARESGANSGRK